MYEVAGNILWIPLLDIWVDSTFNCRDHFTPQEVHELGQSIKVKGQKMPILIQPIEDVPDDERPDPCAWPFSLVAGFRRYAAIDVWTNETRAQCNVVEGLTRQEARALNLIENLQREDLNMVEEAWALEKTYPNEEVKDIARMLGKPKRWVQTRLDLLLLPDYVQEKAKLSKNGLTQYEVEMLAKLPPGQVEPTFQRIVTTKGRPNQKPVNNNEQAWRDRPRGKKEIKNMITLLYMSHKWAGLSVEGRNFVASTLAWVMKGINSPKFMEDRLDYPEGCVMVDENDKVIGFKDSEGNETKF